MARLRGLIRRSPRWVCSEGRLGRVEEGAAEGVEVGGDMAMLGSVQAENMVFCCCWCKWSLLLLVSVGPREMGKKRLEAKGWRRMMFLSDDAQVEEKRECVDVER